MPRSLSTALRAVCLPILLSVVALPAAAEHHETAEAPSPFHADLIADFERASDKLLSLAEAIPADQFGWRPTDEVRTTSQIFVHVVGTNTLLPMALGAAPPEGLQIPEEGPMALAAQWEAEVTAKDDVIAKLKESVDYAAKAMKTIEDLDTEVDLFFPASKRAYLLVLVTHVHEHLGQAIAYARSLGVVPPWSRPAPAEDDAEGR